MDFNRPIAVIDIEASAFKGYPIEIGVAVYRPQKPITLWSSLIRPTPLWSHRLPWDPAAESIHGIKLHLLDRAPSAPTIAVEIHQQLIGCACAYSDNPFHDQRWIELLFETTAIAFPAILTDIAALANNLRVDRRALFEPDPFQPAEHRAGPDADHLLRRLLTLADIRHV
jgi:hypothetical protein